MSERQRRDELRERMQRIAIKPALQRPRPRPRRGMETPARIAPTATLNEDPIRRSRLRTVLAWARWELAVVPEERLRWLLAVARPGDDPQRGHPS